MGWELLVLLPGHRAVLSRANYALLCRMMPRMDLGYVHILPRRRLVYPDEGLQRAAYWGTM